MVNESVIVGLSETMMIRMESLRGRYEQPRWERKMSVTDLELVVYLQVLTSTTLSQDVLQRCRTGGVRDVIVQREGKGKVRLSIGSDVDVLSHTASDGIIVDRIGKLWSIFIRYILTK